MHVILLEKSTYVNLKVEAIGIGSDQMFTALLQEDIPMTISLKPSKRDFKISEALQNNLREYLISCHSHGQFYPPARYWNIQQAFMEESWLIIRESCVPYANMRKSKAGPSYIDVRDNVTFCGRPGIC